MASSIWSSLVQSPPQTQHTQKDSSGLVIGLSQRPLPDNTQHSQETDIHASGGIQTQNLSERLQTSGQPLGSVFLALVDIKYSSGLRFTAPLCDGLKCLFIKCVQKVWHKFGIRKTDQGWEFIMYESAGCTKVKDCLYLSIKFPPHRKQMSVIIKTKRLTFPRKINFNYSGDHMKHFSLCVKWRAPSGSIWQ